MPLYFVEIEHEISVLFEKRDIFGAAIIIAKWNL
jgi:hypothetical protein